MGETGEKVSAAWGALRVLGVGSGARLGSDPFCSVRANVDLLAQWDPR